jgi:hypothetical protein
MDFKFWKLRIVTWPNHGVVLWDAEIILEW